MTDDPDRPPTPEELAAAEELRRALEGHDVSSADDLARVAERVRATAGLAPGLDPGVRDAAIENAIAGASRRRNRVVVYGMLSMAAAVSPAVNMMVDTLRRSRASRP